MQKASDYRKHAEECRALARGMNGEYRDQLLATAVTWEKLADERRDLIFRHPERALEGEKTDEEEAG